MTDVTEKGSDVIKDLGGRSAPQSDLCGPHRNGAGMVVRRRQIRGRSG
jgi:hypothetical protein